VQCYLFDTLLSIVEHSRSVYTHTHTHRICPQISAESEHQSFIIFILDCSNLSKFNIFDHICSAQFDFPSKSVQIKKSFRINYNEAPANLETQ